VSFAPALSPHTKLHLLLRSRVGSALSKEVRDITQGINKHGDTVGLEGEGSSSNGSKILTRGDGKEQEGTNQQSLGVAADNDPTASSSLSTNVVGIENMVCCKDSCRWTVRADGYLTLSGHRVRSELVDGVTRARIVNRNVTRVITRHVKWNWSGVCHERMRGGVGYVRVSGRERDRKIGAK